MTSHECNEFVGTTPTTQSLSFRGEARNLLLTKSWRTTDSSSLRLLGTTSNKFKVGSPRAQGRFSVKKKGAGSACTLRLTNRFHYLYLKFAGNTVNPLSNISTAVK